MCQVITHVIKTHLLLKEIHVVGTNTDFLVLLSDKLKNYINVITDIECTVQPKQDEMKGVEKLTSSKRRHLQYARILRMTSLRASSKKENLLDTSIVDIDSLPQYKVPCSFEINNNIQVLVHNCDITKLQVDAIVNFTNGNLDHAVGIGKIIFDAAGPDMEREGRDMISSTGPLPVSHTLVTSAGELHCKKIIHAVGPTWPFEAGKKKKKRSLKLLNKTFINILHTADKHFVTKLAIPAVTSGEFCNLFPLYNWHDIILEGYSDQKMYNAIVHFPILRYEWSSNTRRVNLYL